MTGSSGTGPSQLALVSRPHRVKKSKHAFAKPVRGFALVRRARRSRSCSESSLNHIGVIAPSSVVFPIGALANVKKLCFSRHFQDGRLAVCASERHFSKGFSHEIDGSTEGFGSVEGSRGRYPLACPDSRQELAQEEGRGASDDGPRCKYCGGKHCETSRNRAVSPPIG